jgi:hypothetical protein
LDGQKTEKRRGHFSTALAHTNAALRAIVSELRTIGSRFRSMHQGIGDADRHNQEQFRKIGVQLTELSNEQGSFFADARTAFQGVDVSVPRRMKELEDLTAKLRDKVFPDGLPNGRSADDADAQ